MRRATPNQALTPRERPHAVDAAPFWRVTGALCLNAGHRACALAGPPPLGDAPAPVEENAMSTNFDPRFLEDLAKRLSDSMPPQLAALKADVEANFKSVLQAGLAKLDLVTRQEFDVQAGVLARTRDKLGALETRLAALEGELSRLEKDAAERVEPPSA
jgi:BMFP domain-containing protein YqiC